MNNDTLSDHAIASFSHHFLVAMPGLNDPYFAQSVTYVFEHTDQGAAGLIINRPTELDLADLFEQLSLEDLSLGSHKPLMSGGPLQTDRGFILHSGEKRWESTLIINEDISVTTSKDILADMAMDKGPEQALVILGYAGWDPGQLEQEIVDNSWLTVPADKQILFHTDTHKQWEKAASKLGVDLSLISQEAGHG